MERINMSKKTNSNLGYFKPLEANHMYGSEYELLKRIYYMNIDIYVDRGDKSSISVEFVDSTTFKRIMVTELSRVGRSKAYHVDITIMDKKYQGQGLAPKLYRHLLKNLDIVLQAGSAQSDGGRQLWNKLCKYRDVSVYGKFNNGQYYQMFADDLDREPTIGYTLGGTLEPYDGRDFTMYASC